MILALHGPKMSYIFLLNAYKGENEQLLFAGLFLGQVLSF